MKKHTAIIVIISMILFITLMQVQQNLSKASADKGAIPKDAIRLRILANSNSAADQMVKREIRDAVNSDIEGWVHDLKTSKQAKKVIDSHIGEIRQTVREKLQAMHLRESFTVKLGEADFPTKMYGGYIYPAGKYQALVITLGSGQGANWWCVLFPPLCFLDFEHGDAVKTKDNQEQTTKASSGQKQAALQKPKGSDQAKTSVQNEKDTGTKTNKQIDSDDEQDGEKPVKVRFFFVDIFLSLIHAIEGLFT